MRDINWAMVERFREMFRDVDLTQEAMHAYQNTAVDFLYDNPYSALFIDMGLGKSVSGGTLIARVLDRCEITSGKKILICGPKRVAEVTWPDEFRRWQHLAHIGVEVIAVDDADQRLKDAHRAGRQRAKEMRYGGAECEKAGRQAASAARETIRRQLANSPKLVHCISRDWLEWLVDLFGRDWPYEIVFVDESSGFKDHSSGRFEALKSVRNHPAHMEPIIKRLHILTATPATEGYEGLFPQIYLLDRGKRLGKNVTEYRKRYFTQNRYNYKWELRPDGEREILAKISDICLIMKKEDHLPSVPPIYVSRYVDMTPAEHDKYTRMEKDMVVELDDGTEVVAETAAAVSQKLLQMASGVLYDTQLIKAGENEDEDLVKVLKIHPIHNHKIDMLKLIVEEARGQQVLVAYHHKSSRARLLEAFKQAVPMDKAGKCIAKWNKGKIPMLLMHPASGGHGLNLQKGGHIIVYFDIPWSLELYLQFIGRLDRQGQQHRVTVFHIVCRGTLDERVLAALTAKEDVQKLLFKIMKKMRAKLKKLLSQRKNALKEDWDRVVEILTDYEHDAVPLEFEEL